jgi:hypothetical protein
MLNFPFSEPEKTSPGKRGRETERKFDEKEISDKTTRTKELGVLYHVAL